jgi:manganese transport protein
LVLTNNLSIPFYFLAEVATACDLAEVLGMIGINLLFGIPLIEGVMITVLDTSIVVLN